jgi:hypothetical protein
LLWQHYIAGEQGGAEYNEAGHEKTFPPRHCELEDILRQFDPDAVQLVAMEAAAYLFIFFIQEKTLYLLIGHGSEVDYCFGARKTMAAQFIGAHIVPVFVAGSGDGDAKHVIGLEGQMLRRTGLHKGLKKITAKTEGRKTLRGLHHGIFV